MHLAGVELAPFAGAHNLPGIGNRRGPVKALAEHIVHEGTRCRVVSAYPYLARQLSVLGLVLTLTSKIRCDQPLDGWC
jgi:hypothetical protein